MYECLGPLALKAIRNSFVSPSSPPLSKCISRKLLLRKFRSYYYPLMMLANASSPRFIVDGVCPVSFYLMYPICFVCRGNSGRFKIRTPTLTFFPVCSGNHISLFLVTSFFLMWHIFNKSPRKSSGEVFVCLSWCRLY